MFDLINSKSGRLTFYRIFVLFFIFSFLFSSLGGIIGGNRINIIVRAAAEDVVFEHVVIDSDNPANPHCKALGDIDNDGYIDAIVASSDDDGMYWYKYPNWDKYAIRDSGSWTTDMQVGDMDGDGDLDAIIPNSSGLQWYENPLPSGDPSIDIWIEKLISADGANDHDVEVMDVDGDGDLDVVTRNKGGYGTYFWQQQDPTSWVKITASSRAGEGTSLGDIDGDGDVDIAQNGFWVEQIDPTTWQNHDIDSIWPNDVGVLITDINNDGNNDIVLAPSESSGRLSWYETYDPVNGPWIEHVIDDSVSYLHTFKSADVDKNGTLDLVTAEMHQSSGPDEVSVYFNKNGDGLEWEQSVVGTTGSHNLRIGDIGSDGDIDLFGTNWNDGSPNSAVVEYWENQLDPWLSLDSWERHVVDDAKPWRSIFIDSGDMDGDGLVDIVTGGWWYKNPGSPVQSWTRNDIGGSLKNMAAIEDVDDDGDLDILGTGGEGSASNDSFSWGRNDGSGSFTVLSNIKNGDGDFLQGVAVTAFQSGNLAVALSWHEAGKGVQRLTIPQDPSGDIWSWDILSSVSQDEDLSAGDIDQDGDVDLLLGTKWLKNDGLNWIAYALHSTGDSPDRNRLADINQDGRLDAIVGYEAISTTGKLAWYEQPEEPTDLWEEHVIANIVGPMSLDTADMDNDGDFDVVIGEHNLSDPASAKLYIFENVDGIGTDWAEHVVYMGDEHHDGAQVSDIDGDGDLDIISIGWNNNKVIWYENTAIIDPDIDMTPPELSSAVAYSDDQVRVVFSEEADKTTAEDINNYAIDNGVTIFSAVLETGNETVTLTTSVLVQGVEYVLTVNNIGDLAENVIEADSQAIFEYIPVNVPEGRVAHWTLDEGDGTVATDSSGNGHDGNVYGASWTTGKLSNALDFDGTDDYVDIRNFNPASEAISLTAWVNSDDLDSCGSYRDCRIISKANGTAEQDHDFMVSTIVSGSNTRLRFRLRTSGTTHTLIASSGNLAENEWIHVAAVYDGSNMILHKDGVQVGSMSKTGPIDVSSNSIWIGQNPGGAKPWNGRIDDVRIYDRALIAEEAEKLASEEPAPPDTTPPVINNDTAINITDTNATITWDTDEPADSQVEYGTTTTLGTFTVLDTALVTAHSVDLTGLEAENIYYYRVYSKDASANLSVGAEQTFTAFTLYVNTDGSCGGKTPCYTSIQAAINAAYTGADIRITQGTYAESITLNTSKSLTLQGGWNSAFSSQTPNTTFIKAPKAPRGSLSLQMLTVKP